MEEKGQTKDREMGLHPEIRKAIVDKDQYFLEDRYIDEKAAAEILACSLQKLRNDRSQQRGLSYFKVGRSVRYSRRDIFSYMAARRIVPQETCRSAQGRS